MLFFTCGRHLPANAASLPVCCGTKVSMCCRHLRANTGAVPPLETAICSGLRLITAGTVNEHNSSVSTVLQNLPRASAA